MYQSMKGYIDVGIQTSLFALNTSKHHVDLPIEDSYFERLDTFQTTYLDNSLKPASAISNLLGRQSYVLSRFISKEVIESLSKCIEELQPDVVQFETLSMAYYIAILKTRFQRVQMVYRMHNVEYEIWETLATESSYIKKKYLNLNVSRLRKEEKLILEAADKVLCISAADAQWVELHIPEKIKRVYPFAIDVHDFEITPQKNINFYHLGSMDWQPNIDAMNWWITDIWPRFTKAEEFPFYMAGRYLKPSMYDTSNLRGVNIVGEVESIDSFLKDKSVLVVPLRSGSGMRIKILEAIQRGILVISTSLGLSGISGKNGTHFLVADTAEDFLTQMNKVCNQPNLIQEIAENAKKLVRDKYNLRKEIEQNLKFFGV